MFGTSHSLLSNFPDSSDQSQWTNHVVALTLDFGPDTEVATQDTVQLTGAQLDETEACLTRLNAAWQSLSIMNDKEWAVLEFTVKILHQRAVRAEGLSRGRYEYEDVLEPSYRATEIEEARIASVTSRSQHVGILVLRMKNASLIGFEYEDSLSSSRRPLTHREMTELAGAIKH